MFLKDFHPLTGLTITKKNGVQRTKKGIVEINGHKYERKWILNEGENIIDGCGVIIYSDGDRYDGYFQYNKLNCRGRMIYASGTVYEGEWKDDNRHGKGNYTHLDGLRYEGEWFEDKRHGT